MYWPYDWPIADHIAIKWVWEVKDAVIQNAKTKCTTLGLRPKLVQGKNLPLYGHQIGMNCDATIFYARVNKTRRFQRQLLVTL